MALADTVSARSPRASRVKKLAMLPVGQAASIRTTNFVLSGIGTRRTRRMASAGSSSIWPNSRPGKGSFRRTMWGISRISSSSPTASIVAAVRPEIVISNGSLTNYVSPEKLRLAKKVLVRL